MKTTLRLRDRLIVALLRGPAALCDAFDALHRRRWPLPPPVVVPPEVIRRPDPATRPKCDHCAELAAVAIGREAACANDIDRLAPGSRALLKWIGRR